ncbi:MAG: alcohol dehydrogenase catalytic domain-containing protein [Candidatus Hydrogenedentes bacterium]|nr:alcohol dehydrogenase catalytic domain-containing protein [Candidatus Hydrogenedentota bacterium]
MNKLDRYKRVDYSLPDKYYAWLVYGSGIDNVGKDGKPVEIPLREPNENEILVRIDALGICLSDIKIITLGGAHPRLRGRNLSEEPIVLGHECAVTVVKAGKLWAEQFKKGERFIVQADIYYKGVGYAFGYLIPGGMEQFTYLDEKSLAGDDGCYLLKVKDTTGYSASALAEPWACVEMSYRLEDRVYPASDSPWYVSTTPKAEVKEKFPKAKIYTPAQLPDSEEKVQDIIIDDPNPNLVEKCWAHLASHGTIYLLAEPDKIMNEYVNVDVGSIHYEYKRIIGGGNSLEKVKESNSRSDLLPDGVALFIGAGGPMGQMHVQRALEKKDGPRKVVVTDLDSARLEHLKLRLSELLSSKKAELITICTRDFPNPQELNNRLRELAPDGYSDVVLLAPVPALVTDAIELTAPKGFVNLFAGLGIGTIAKVPLKKLCEGVKIIGCSGSRISDLQHVLEAVEAGERDTNRSVAVIGGLLAAREGLVAVKEARYPGKIVIYPQIVDLPLIPLEEIPKRLPDIAKYLSKDGTWTKEAEEALLERFLPWGT